MNLTPEQTEIGKDNYHESVGGIRRREFLAGAAAATTGLGAMYFGYEKVSGSPVKVGFIGTGDEGNILLTEHPADYMDVVAIADVRPSNQKRAFHGDGNKHRKGLKEVLGSSAPKNVRVFNSHKELIAAKDELGLEAVVIATPLVSHAPIAIACLNAGLHVLCEKLMAKSIGECKEMIRVARENDRLLAVGHQRHYSVLYDNANQIVQQGLLGEIKFIRAQWHRNNSFPNRDSWVKLPDVIKKHPEDIKALEDNLDVIQEIGFETPEQFIEWRLFNNTGGGLMAELGSHQMDAASIFLGKVHPVAVQGFGGRNFYGIKGVGPKDKWDDKREIDDQIFVTFEFPGDHYEEDQDDKCIVTYSSMSTNRFEPYGESVYGSRATLIMKAEKDALLYKEASAGNNGGGPDQRLWVVNNTKDGGPVLEAYETTTSAATTSKQASPDDVSRGYREEMEHFAFAIRNQGEYYPGGKPLPPKQGGLRCNGEVAMADAVMALTANLAMKHKRRIEFRPEWFEVESSATPEEDVKKMVGGSLA
ncbi:Gfo/Idh/MocA family protein [Stratiformator vulcanicus]|uniref:Glucose--fructose oxidoreductase n=1 Tax=Stratiformator vulcanicus TaxID=2527980 RepID=A0A517R081_9PLAN|nr:Gfo/Idh/MocA family oxidoreductase [Stratiformator vulcanicus]QDT37306.1 Glucose--fructose oxidoreductase precursor [Stratiformator vulcanicus]